MHADFDLDDDGIAQPRTPYRPGKGRPAGFTPRQAKLRNSLSDDGSLDIDGLDTDDLVSEEVKQVVAAKKQAALARKETALAGINELVLKVKSGEYLPRAAYREATATLLASLSQGLRSIPDTLERKFSLPPEVLEFVEQTLTEALAETADSLALFTDSGNP